MSNRFLYEGDRLNEISFPLGGIGTGSIGLAGNGRLIDWEIRNRPNKGSVNGFSHFAVKVEDDSSLLDTRVLNGDLGPPYTGSFSSGTQRLFGSGVPREHLSGLPHFRDVSFRGEYPFAKLEFADESFPGTVVMTAFNPLIPGNDRDSSIPAAFFELSVRNTGERRLRYTFAASLNNPFRIGRNEYRTVREQKLIYLNGLGIDAGSPEYGNLTIATDASEVSFQEYWFRGPWWDNLSVYWHDLNSFGPFANRRYADADSKDSNDHGLLAAHFDLDPGAEASARFVISWSYPNVTNYWNPATADECDGDESCCPGGDCGSATWKNYYAVLFSDSAASSIYCLENWSRLFEETELFKKTLFSSTLPEEVIDAASANISILKSPTVLRLEDGTFYGFEGCNPYEGCCEGSCTHVWNYAYALPFLFPNLERTMRDADYRNNLDDAGGMRFRLQLPIGRESSRFRPCADGQFGGIIKMYREWKISGDTEWLRSHWEAIKRNIEYAWSENNPDRWDRDRDGVLEGRQHHTLDVELFGPNSWLTGFYLAALLAASKMADYLGEPKVASSYRELYERGKSWVDIHLFNGEYYSQGIDLSDKAMLESYVEGGESAASFYWDDEHSEIKYQIADGCGIDQVIAQWHANLVGLDEIFDHKQTRSALRSIFRYNFKRSMREHANPCRVYALNEEAALLICSFPKTSPIIAIPYAEEAMNGFEYQAACHMIQEGMIDEGLEIVRGVRDRYDGVRRNPWNEFECGSNYARSMASYSLVIAMSGFEYDMVDKHVGFRPFEVPFRCFWSLDSGWGEVVVDEKTITLVVLKGSLSLLSFRCSQIGARVPTNVSVGDNIITVEKSEDLIRFDEVRLDPHSPLVVILD